MKRTLTAALAIAAGTALLYGSTTQAMTRKAGKLTATNLMAHLGVDCESVPHASGASPSTMQATYTVSNPTNETIIFPQHGQPVDWKIVDSHGAVVYNANAGKIAPHFVAMRILGPNEHQDFTSTVSLQDQNGAPLSPGHYSLQACLRGVDNLKTTKSFTIK